MRPGLLWLCLLTSVSLNVVLLWQVYQPSETRLPSPADNSALLNSSLPPARLSNGKINEQVAAPDSQGWQASSPESVTSNDTELLNREELLQQARQWLQDDDVNALRGFLQGYLQQHPLDMDFLLIEAELNVRTELLSDAIAHYYSLTRLPMTSAQQENIANRIEELSSATIAQLQRAYSWDTLAIFVEPLLQLEPENRRYILALAEAYAQQMQVNLMENVLASLDFDDPAAINIRRLTQLSQVSDDDTTQESDDQLTDIAGATHSAVKLIQTGDQFVAQGQLGGNPVSLLIDTGASITAVSRQYFDELDSRYKIHYLGRFSVNTAGGKVLAPMYQFSELTLNHASVKDLSVVVLPMRNAGNVNGLLGMNFLREFDFKIDQRQSQLWLRQQN